MAQLEICVDTIAGLKAAIEGGADRIELCSALTLGGISPSQALLEAARDCPVPAYAMVRPRAGDFDYSDAEIAAMELEIDHVREMGLAGVVFGAGTSDGLDYDALEFLCDAAEDLGMTLHRVVDLLPERLSILKPVWALGFERILTSGGQARADDGIEDIRSMIEAAPEDLSIMPGSGVTPDNAAKLLAETGAFEIHASAGVPGEPAEARLVELGFASPDARQATVESVRLLKDQCGAG